MCVLRPRNFCGTSLPSALSRTPRKGSFPLFCSFLSFLAGNLCLLKIMLWKSLTILFSLWPDRTSVRLSTCFSIMQPSWARCLKAFSPKNAKVPSLGCSRRQDCEKACQPRLEVDGAQQGHSHLTAASPVHPERWTFSGQERSGNKAACEKS